MLLATSTGLCPSAEPQGFFWFKLLLLIHVWCLPGELDCCFSFVFDILLMNWTADSEDGNCPKELFLSRSTDPVFY